MALPKAKLREAIFQILYSSDLGSEEEPLELIMRQLFITKKQAREAVAAAQKVKPFFEEIDPLIDEYSKGYDLEKLSPIERTILRVGAYEILHDEDVPREVAITEAMRIVRKFGSREASTYINAILDKICC